MKKILIGSLYILFAPLLFSFDGKDHPPRCLVITMQSGEGGWISALLKEMISLDNHHSFREKIVFNPMNDVSDFLSVLSQKKIVALEDPRDIVCRCIRAIESRLPRHPYRFRRIWGEYSQAEKVNHIFHAQVPRDTFNLDFSKIFTLMSSDAHKIYYEELIAVREGGTRMRQMHAINALAQFLNLSLSPPDLEKLHLFIEEKNKESGMFSQNIWERDLSDYQAQKIVIMHLKEILKAAGYL